jgi:FkbM family methyltransferase
MSNFPIPSYSHSGEDRLIWKLFGYRTTGTYIDVGCYHPTEYSNTYLLYRAGWRGLVVDADDHFLPFYRELRPEDHVLHAAIAKQTGSVTLFTFADRSLNTINAAVAAAYEAKNPSTNTGQVVVQVQRLDRVLEREAVAHVDFLNIDVEGADLDVLESNDWQRWTPDVIAIEDHQIDLRNVQASETWRFLSGHRYLLHSKCNYTSVYCRV